MLPEDQGYYEAMRPEEYPGCDWCGAIVMFGLFAIWLISIFVYHYFGKHP